ncbi:MAG: aromatic amino acid lyase, partial [Candidatus Krumholzibacteria bacterium]|nr:aromatic amino acid lyase [Candidatus Krumholzibacteria bacterium]
MRQLRLDGETLTLTQVEAFLAKDAQVDATETSWEKVAAGARFCEEIAYGDKTYYGINTGFGVLANKRIAKASLEKLQRNLLRSHATGMGADLPEDIVRLMLLLRVNSLLRGYSGVSTEVIKHLLAFINRGLIPAIPAYGSVGASGDLAPLAHMSLPLIGEGWAYLGG